MRAAVIAVLALSAASAASAQEAAKPPAGNMLQALEAAGLDPETKVEDGKAQVMLQQRAIIRLKPGGEPMLEDVQAGRLGLAAPEGEETYKGVGAGRLAFALDASQAKRQSIMKVWNGLTTPVAFEVEIAAIRQGQLMRRMAPVCAVPAGSTHVETWPDPVVAVTIQKFAPPDADTPTCK
ncbi:hypothetical protein [Phenylobacterium koreense]|uniref:Uncharacterized protein n=1 Tax=Phenylobacterium koreense TaxID=266125 RepID=A0ABV2EPP9_9CAUL